jgi:hypothetical protein
LPWCRSTLRLTKEDINMTQADMREIHSALSTLVGSRDRWTRTDVSTACFLLFSMVEVGWTMLVHAAEDRSPTETAFSKFNTTASTFKPALRGKKGDTFKLPKCMNDPTALPRKARSELLRLMTLWSPYKAGDDTVYNGVSYWLMALRVARDMGTHRTLAHVLPAPPVGLMDAGPVDAGPVPAVGGGLVDFSALRRPLVEVGQAAAWVVKLPAHPAEDVGDYFAGLREMPELGKTDVFKDIIVPDVRGYRLVPVATMAANMLVVATVVCEGLVAVTELCRPMVVADTAPAYAPAPAPAPAP